VWVWARRSLPLQPLPWSNFFERARDVPVPAVGTVRVYESGQPQEGKSLFVLVHGAGLSAQSWATAAVRMCTERERERDALAPWSYTTLYRLTHRRRRCA
jgi:hypothetical protein